MPNPDYNKNTELLLKYNDLTGFIVIVGDAGISL
jgi:hypothetical protein